jgi:type IV pilus assembly protein PilN
MRVTLNLASRPYVELRAVFAFMRIVAGVLVLLALLQWLALRGLERKATLADANVRHWTHLTHALEREWEQDQAMMREPQNAVTLDKSDFLNGLFARKAFSWTAALMDLENVLPAGVQVVSMEPQMTKDSHVQLRLRVSGDRNKEVDLVKNLEGSKHFLFPRIIGESAQQAPTGKAGFVPPSATTDVNFDILAEYNPQRMEDASAGSKKGSGPTGGQNADNKAAHLLGPASGKPSGGKRIGGKPSSGRQRGAP